MIIVKRVQQKFDAQVIRRAVPKIRPAILNFWRGRSRRLEIEEITYLSQGLKVKGFIVFPKKRRGKLPCIIYNRGGHGDFSDLWPMQVYRIMSWIADHGYVVMGSRYRGNGGGEGREDYGGNDVHDVTNLIPVLRKIPFADTNRIGMVGASRGGMMTYLALRKLRNLKAAAIIGGSSDLIRQRKTRPRMERYVFRKYIHSRGRAYLTALRQRSVVYWPEKIAPKTPLLLQHGTADWRVDPEDSIRLTQALIKLRRPVRLSLYEGADHGLEEVLDESRAELLDWLDRFVKRTEKIPNTKPHGL